MGAFAQLDRAMLVKRLRDGREAKTRAGGKPTGRYPYGWSKDGPVPDAAHHRDRPRTARHRQDVGRRNRRDQPSRFRWHARTGRAWTRQNLAAAAD